MKHAYALTAALVAAISIPSIASAAPTLMDGSFETPTTSNFIYTPSVSGVTFNAGSGVQRNGSDWGFNAAPDGVQTAFIQSSRTYIGQITFALTNLIVGQAYDVNFFGAARPGYSSNTFTVAVDGANLGGFNLTSNTWQALSARSFIATATNASLSFTGSPTTTGDNDVGLDNVTITASVPEPATWAMMTLGFGAVGFAMRRKKVSTRVRFA